MSSSRCLRIGVVLGDRLVDERIADGATPVTLGQSIKCALSVPVEGVPREHVLFAVDQGRFVLRTLAGMDGRLAQKGGAIEVIGGPGERMLQPGARGKLKVGEATILFQEIARPAKAPRPQLPASVRGTFADRIDRRLAMIIGASLVAHIAIAVWAWQGDIEHELLAPPEPTSQFEHATIDVDTIDLTAPQPGAATPVAPLQTPHPIVHPTRITTTPTAPSLHVPTNDDAARLAAILASSDESPHGPTGMSHRQPGADLDKQIAEVKGRKITIGDGGHTSRVDDRAHRGDGTDHFAIDDPSITRTPEQHENEPHTRLVLTPHPPQPGDDPMPDNVLSKIRALYLPGLQRCYKKTLLEDPHASGKVALAFTIDERGHVTDASATGVADKMSSCVEAQMGLWRFAIPKDKAGDPTEQSYKITLACSLGE